MMCIRTAARAAAPLRFAAQVRLSSTQAAQRFTPVRGLEAHHPSAANTASDGSRTSLVSDTIVGKLTNSLMYDGQKAAADRVVQELLTHIKMKGQSGSVGAKAADPMGVLVQAIENAKPLIETRPVRVGGSIYQVPTPVPPKRRQSLAIRWIIKAARDKKAPYAMSERLYKEVMDCYTRNPDGAVMKKRMEVHKQAEANRAYAHFRW